MAQVENITLGAILRIKLYRMRNTLPFVSKLSCCFDRKPKFDCELDCDMYALNFLLCGFFGSFGWLMGQGLEALIVKFGSQPAK